MKISVNWIRQLVDFELPPVDELVAKIGAQLGAVENVENLGEKYQGIIVAKVVECEKHPNADKLSLCKIDDGGKAKNIERDENGLVQVVCGAPNVRAGILVAWLPPGSTVPSTFANDPFVLEARELRGIKSNGMLASAKELAISDDHEGILEIDKEAKPGDDFAKLYKLYDFIIDIENKMFTHRPDCFGALGVAREIAGILGHRFVNPDWYWKIPEFENGRGLELEIFNEVPEKVPRFMAVAMKNVKVKPSPVWLQIALSKIGQKPINNIVDATNFIMQLTGQPTHAYDYDKLAGHKLGARMAKKGETTKLLNGKTYELDGSDIIIADREGIIGLGGVMGGLDSEVTSETNNIVLECANFDMYSVRKSSMRHGLFTDAVTRFSKDQSLLQNARVLSQLIEITRKIAGGEPASEVFDINSIPKEVSSSQTLHDGLAISPNFINQRLGLKLVDEEIGALLQNVNFAVYVVNDLLNVTAPFWRTDIEIPEDIVEEVGRLYGYDKLPLELPKRSIKPVSKNELLETKHKIREVLAKAGANEVLSYSFVHGNLLDKAGQDRELAFKLSNALSPELQYYRLTLTPSLLDKIHGNIKAGYDEFVLFELGKGHNLIHKSDEDDGVPPEFNFLDLVYASSKKGKSGAAFYKARKFLDFLAKDFGLQLSYASVAEDPHVPPSDLYDLERAAYVSVKQTGEFLGMIGEFKPSVRKNFKLPKYAAGFCIGPEVLLSSGKKSLASSYQPLPKYPKVEQDITLKVAKTVNYQELSKLLEVDLEELKPKLTFASLEPLGIYQSEEDKEYKNITFRLKIASYEKTMKSEEVNSLLDQVALAAKQKLGAERV